jgi:hypothetical protein
MLLPTFSTNLIRRRSYYQLGKLSRKEFPTLLKLIRKQSKSGTSNTKCSFLTFHSSNEILRNFSKNAGTLIIQLHGPCVTAFTGKKSVEISFARRILADSLSAVDK